MARIEQMPIGILKPTEAKLLIASDAQADKAAVRVAVDQRLGWTGDSNHADDAALVALAFLSVERRARAMLRNKQQHVEFDPTK